MTCISIETQERKVYIFSPICDIIISVGTYVYVTVNPIRVPLVQKGEGDTYTSYKFIQLNSTN
nr:MAG TPA: hypothetical protein [Caudoviricetes sp.]